MEETIEQQPSDCLKVVLFGPESTGKTTLTKQLAAHYQTQWVPEFARDYLQAKWDREQKSCEPKDLMPIAVGQMALENEVAQQAHKILICDTDLLETKVYSEIYYDGFCPEPIAKAALSHQYDLYFLTDIHVPWEADDLRDRPLLRHSMFEAFKATLDRYQKPYILLTGTKEVRFETAVKAIEVLMGKS